MDDFLDDKEMGKVLRGEGRRKERRDRSCGGGEVEQFEVDRLLEHKMSRSGELSLLVKWGGAHIDCEPTWEPEEGVNEEAMEEYEKVYSAHFVMLPSNFREVDLAVWREMQMRTLLFDVQRGLKEGLADASKVSGATDPKVVAYSCSCSMIPEVFVSLFRAHLPAGMSTMRALLGVRVEISLDDMKSVCDPFLANWHIARAHDGFIARVMHEHPLHINFVAKITEDYDHSKCIKCITPFTTADLLARRVPTTCVATVVKKAYLSVVRIDFHRTRHNGTAYYANVRGITY